MMIMIQVICQEILHKKLVQNSIECPSNHQPIGNLKLDLGISTIIIIEPIQTGTMFIARFIYVITSPMGLVSK